MSNPEGENQETDGQAPVDPWRGFRGVMAGTLILETIVVLLAVPVVKMVGGGLSPLSLIYLIGVAVAMILLSGMQGRPWALQANLALQVVLVAGFFVHAAIGFVGLLFLGVWLLIWYMRNQVRDRQGRGELPGQRGATTDQ
ncbi:hypothetical protein BKG82_04720 [Mycobacteroides chelonae]|uniref:DUF4233 domain-containing protein n=2 Tax=Mycobacteriaceae TaxID=1762 RepID=A0A1S1LU57_MYCCH|nr:hypothetical protein AOT87_04665 [Mycobacteroides sp. H003]KRQ32461.1 hypothetical protein AOT91_11190 [Mycobacteroides sp. H092]KRQ42194.1 hypothetical protein AOT88_25910 [Mycobacteroides sp. H063]KRQ43704.1 hypothetical protein AOT92_08140 [Mycobacteroides sp. H101]KRQ54429.1 hypothetical protein AOT94_23175 [Mycobacteroides sp. HXVII]KRQ62290.1 hypothetical protein AOT90_15605 [Mycobacteroides sp. H079]KRQ67659.1 hypothetical protein AOT89_14455 [Mycobacteroides sp. H070]KRQ78979.1 hy